MFNVLSGLIVSAFLAWPLTFSRLAFGGFETASCRNAFLKILCLWTFAKWKFSSRSDLEFANAYSSAPLTAKRVLCIRRLYLVYTMLSCQHTQKQIFLNIFWLSKLVWCSHKTYTFLYMQFLSAVMSIRFVRSAFRSTEFSEVYTLLKIFVSKLSPPNLKCELKEREHCCQS